VKQVQIWTEDYFLARELSGFSSFRYGGRRSVFRDKKSNYEHLITKHCREFWLNHLPPSLNAHHFQWQLIDHFKTIMRQNMDSTYSEVLAEYEPLIEDLRRQYASSLRECAYTEATRVSYILTSYLTLITRHKSLKQIGLTIEQAVKRLKCFHRDLVSQVKELSQNSRVEHTVDPVGLAILSIEDKACVKSKSAIIEFVYKNLLVGNAVLVVCPRGLLGARFPQDLYCLDIMLPFALVEFDPSSDGTIAETYTGNHVAQSQAKKVERNSSINSSIGICADAIASSERQSLDSQLLSENKSVRLMKMIESINDSALETSGIGSIDSCKSPRQSIDVFRTHKCPRNVYVIKLNRIISTSKPLGQELTSDLADTVVTVLGCKRRSLWLARKPTVRQESRPSSGIAYDLDESADLSDPDNYELREQSTIGDQSDELLCPTDTSHQDFLVRESMNEPDLSSDSD